jgi:2-isopropylmalate synthase
MKKIQIYDTTLRDGGQDPRINFSGHDKLEIARRLDQFGVTYIELGWPGSNEKDSAVFKEAKNIHLKNAEFVAFGMTCQKGKKPEDDPHLLKLVEAATKIVAIVGKTSKQQVEKTLGVTPKDNLALIRETCRFLVENGKEVFFDAEHFFDGWKSDCIYALSCIDAAIEGGASRIVLCDTNGGSLPEEITVAVSAVKDSTRVPIGIHAHNDGGMAISNSLAGVKAGADQVQVTVNGYGERCGNANLCSIVPALKLKMGLDCISDDNMSQLVNLARFVAEVANLPIGCEQPYVGAHAFRHKAGLHVNAIGKYSNSYNHINPELVGNKSSIIVSEISGKSNVVMKATELGVNLSKEQIEKVLVEIEHLENEGFQFEGADGSLKLIMMRQLDNYSQPFEVIKREVNSRKIGKEKPTDSAVVKILIKMGKDEISHNVADGDGPVNAIDNALRKGLLPHFPYLESTKLVDYKVRVLSGKKGTAKAVRILIDFSDGSEEWTTIGCSTDSIEASLQALVDGFEYSILKNLR